MRLIVLCLTPKMEAMYLCLYPFISITRISRTCEALSLDVPQRSPLFAVPCLALSAWFSDLVDHLKCSRFPHVLLPHLCATSWAVDGFSPCAISQTTVCDDKCFPRRLKRPYPPASVENGHSTQSSCSVSDTRSKIHRCVGVVRERLYLIISAPKSLECTHSIDQGWLHQGGYGYL